MSRDSFIVEIYKTMKTKTYMDYYDFSDDGIFCLLSAMIFGAGAGLIPYKLGVNENTCALLFLLGLVSGAIMHGVIGLLLNRLYIKYFAPRVSMEKALREIVEWKRSNIIDLKISHGERIQTNKRKIQYRFNEAEKLLARHQEKLQEADENMVPIIQEHINVTQAIVSKLQKELEQILCQEQIYQKKLNSAQLALDEFEEIVLGIDILKKSRAAQVEVNIETRAIGNSMITAFARIDKDMADLQSIADKKSSSAAVNNEVGYSPHIKVEHLGHETEESLRIIEHGG